FIHCSRQEAFAERAIWHESDSELLKGRNHFLLGSSCPQRVFALECCQGLNGVCTTDRFCGCLGKSEVLDLACLNQFLHGTRDLFDRHVRIHPVLIQQVDGFDFEPLERAFDGFLDVLRPAIQLRRCTGHATRILAGTDVETEFSSNYYLTAVRSERFTHKLFVQERPVDFGGIKERNATINGGMEQSCHLLLVLGRTVRKAHSHATEADGRDFQIAFSKCAFLHCFSLQTSFPRNWVPVTMLLLHGVSPASEQVESPPKCGKHERRSFRPRIREGKQLHSTRERNCSDSGEQAGDELRLERAESWTLLLAGAAAEYGN